MNNIVKLHQQPTLSAVDMNVASLANTGNLAAANIEKKTDIFFPVRQQPLYELTGMHDRNLSAIVREDTNEVLAVHGSRYNLIKNEVVYEGIDHLIRNTPSLDTNGMLVQDQVAYAGGRTIRSYVFPEHEVRIGRDDVTQLKLNVINSYDGSTNLRICMGGFRIVCANGMVVGETFGDFASRHTGTFTPEEVAPRIAASLNNFLQVGESWKHWASTPCTDAKAAAVIAKLAGKSVNLSADLTLFWQEEKIKMGATMWSLFNALTYWSTHYGIKAANEANKAAIVQSRESRVTSILRSPLFLEAA